MQGDKLLRKLLQYFFLAETCKFFHMFSGIFLDTTPVYDKVHSRKCYFFGSLPIFFQTFLVRNLLKHFSTILPADHQNFSWLIFFKSNYSPPLSSESLEPARLLDHHFLPPFPVPKFVLKKGEEPCACGSLKPYAECCQPYHREEKYPETAVDLLRWRTQQCKIFIGFLNPDLGPQNSDKTKV